LSESLKGTPVYVLFSGNFAGKPSRVKEEAGSIAKEPKMPNPDIL